MPLIDKVEKSWIVYEENRPKTIQPRFLLENLEAAAAPKGTVMAMAAPLHGPWRSLRIAAFEPPDGLSIIDKAVLLKQSRQEGSTTLGLRSSGPRMHGDLPTVDDMLAVAVDIGGPLFEFNISTLASACDIAHAELDSSVPLVNVGSP